MTQETQKNKIIKAQRRIYFNHSTTTQSSLTSKDMEKKLGTNKLKDQPATKWRGDYKL